MTQMCIILVRTLDNVCYILIMHFEIVPFLMVVLAVFLPAVLSVGPETVSLIFK